MNQKEKEKQLEEDYKKINEKLKDLIDLIDKFNKSADELRKKMGTKKDN